MRIPVLATFLAAIVLLFSIPSPAAAQQPGAGAGVPVQMVVTVKPKHGNQVPPISQRDVIVHMGHDVRPVTDWVPATANYGGLALAVLIDEASGSSLGVQLNDIKNFIAEQAPTTLVAVGYMHNGTVSIAQNFTADHAAAAKSLRLALGYFGAEASPYTSVSDFIKRWTVSSATPRREVLMITSGIDTLYRGAYPDPYVDAAVQDAQCGGVVVFSVYTPGAGRGRSRRLTYWGQNFLSQLSSEAGGESYYLMGRQAPPSFSPYLDEMNQRLQNQYLLTFLAEPPKKKGPEPIAITSEIHSVDLLHANRVCVPASAGQ